MKNIITTLAILLLSLTACEDSLDLAPETIITQDNFYITESDFEQAVIGIYEPLQAIYEEHWELTELRSDNTYFIYNVGNRGGKPTEDLATFTVETNNVTVQNNWSNNFLVISRANQVLANIENATFDDAAKNNLKGQALFLRALAYFDLAKNFGGVPLFLEPPTNYDETFRDRATAQEIYDQVILDASESVNLLPAKSSASIGRATSGAARTLLADVYMFLGRWAEAEEAITPVLSMGYSLLPNYIDVFDPLNKGNDEIIFEVGYITGTSQPLFSSFPYSFIPATPDPSVITGVSPATPNGGGSNNIPTPEMLAAYEDIVNDERYSASIGFHSGPGSLVGIPTYNNQPYVKKYLFPHSVYNQTDQNWPVYRYAEVLLMYAEILNELNNSAQALLPLNQVRNRAGLLTDIITTDKALLKDAILRERRVELAFENKRWSDLVRTGNMVSVMTAFGNAVIANPELYYYPPGNFPPPNAFNISNDFKIYPIPIADIIVNPDLEPNPGY